MLLSSSELFVYRYKFIHSLKSCC